MFHVILSTAILGWIFFLQRTVAAKQAEHLMGFVHFFVSENRDSKEDLCNLYSETVEALKVAMP